MTLLTCPRCGTSFETAATTNTRCRSCRAVVRVPASGDRGAPPRAAKIPRPSPGTPVVHYVLALDCGHVRTFEATPIPEERVSELEWTCGECGSTGVPAAIVGALTPEQRATLTGKDYAALRTRGTELLARR